MLPSEYTAVSKSPRAVTASVPGSLVTLMILQFSVGGAILPFIALVLRDRGLDLTQISSVFMVSASTALVFPFLWGMLADRFIPLNRLFTLLNGLTLVALIVFSRQTDYLGLLIAYTGFHACFNPTLMLINPLSYHHLQNPREQFGWLRAWGSVGWIIPSLPVFVWLVLSPSGDLTFAVRLAGLLAVGALAASLVLPHTAPGAARARPVNAGLDYWTALRRLLGNLDFLALLGALFLVAGSFSLYAYYSAPLLEDLGLHRSWIGPVQSAGVVLEIFLFRWRARLVGRSGYANSILAGCLTLVVRQALCGWTSYLPALILSYLLIGGVVVFFYIGASMLVDQIATREVRSTAQTLLVLCGSGLGPMFANASAGRLSQWGYDIPGIFRFATLLTVLAFVILALRRRHLDQHDHQPNRPSLASTE